MVVSPVEKERKEEKQSKEGKSSDLQMLKPQNSLKIPLIPHCGFCMLLGELTTYTTFLLRQGEY